MSAPAAPFDRVAVVGPGRVGTTLALALPRERYRVTAVAGRGADSLARFRVRIPEATELGPAAAARAADLVVVAVPDDALADIVREVVRDDGVAPGSRWVHVAGSAGLGPLRPARLAGARIAACHPAQTFPDSDVGVSRLRGAAWAVTAAERDRDWATAFVTDLGGEAHRVADEARATYHAALAIGANGTSAVICLGRDLLLAAGVGTPEEFLEPLASSAAIGAARHGPEALTGPVRRGDAGTVSAHLAELRVAMPEALEVYRALARLALSYARRAGLGASEAAAVAAVLDADDADDAETGGRHG